MKDEKPRDFYDDIVQSFEAAQQRWQHDQRLIPKDSVSLRDQFAMAAIGRCLEIAAQFVMDADDFVPDSVNLSEVVRRGVVMAYSTADMAMAERDKKR